MMATDLPYGDTSKATLGLPKTKTPQQQKVAKAPVTATLSRATKTNAAPSLKTAIDADACTEDSGSAESISDIFSKRLRTLRKRLTKIEKNEELLAKVASEEARLKHPHSAKSQSAASTTEAAAGPLNADQLKAIEKKEMLLEIMQELEHLNSQVVDWQKTQSGAKSSKGTKTECGSNEKSAALTHAQDIPPTQLTQEARQEMLHLWIALCRLDAVSTTLLSPEDFQALKTLYLVIHSLVIAPEHDSGLHDLLAWMKGDATSLEGSDSLTSLLPPYKVIKYCVGKILAAPMSANKLPAGLGLSPKALFRAELAGKNKESSKSTLASAPMQPAPVAAPSLESKLVKERARTASNDAIPHAVQTASDAQAPAPTPIPTPAMVLPTPAVAASAASTTAVATPTTMTATTAHPTVNATPNSVAPPPAAAFSVHAPRSSSSSSSSTAAAQTANNNVAASSFLATAYTANPTPSFGPSTPSSTTFVSYPGFLPSGSAFGLGSSGMYSSSQQAANGPSASPPPPPPSHGPAFNGTPATQPSLFFDGTSPVPRNAPSASQKPFYSETMNVASPPPSSNRSTQSAQAVTGSVTLAPIPASTSSSASSSSTAATSWTFPTDSAILRAGPAFPSAKTHTMPTQPMPETAAAHVNVISAQQPSVLEAKLSAKELEAAQPTSEHPRNQTRFKGQKDGRAPMNNADLRRQGGSRGGLFPRRARPTEAFSEPLPGSETVLRGGRGGEGGGAVTQGAWKQPREGGPRPLRHFAAAATGESQGQPQLSNDREATQAPRRRHYQRPFSSSNAKTAPAAHQASPKSQNLG